MNWMIDLPVLNLASPYIKFSVMKISQGKLLDLMLRIVYMIEYDDGDTEEMYHNEVHGHRN